MKIKSLLIGSAAAVVGVSSANAADIIIPEPEMVEYVRVCDAAGTGYFYIPGTETCLVIGGYVRYDIGFGELNSRTDAVTGDETWNKRARAQLEFDTWTDTELGDLRTDVTLRVQWDSNNATVRDAAGNATATGYSTDLEWVIRSAYIDLAGLRIGKDESFFTTFTGYAGAVINDTVAGGYGPFDTNLMSYTFSQSGFTAGISLEQGANTLNSNATNFGTTITGWGIDDYVPHVVAGVGYDGGAFEIRGVFGYDTRNGVNRGGWSGKLRGDVDFDPFSAFLMLLYGENSSAYTTWANGLVTDETFSVIGGASVDFTDNLAFNMQVQWADGNGQAGGDDWSVAANVNYEITDGFIVRPELVYADLAGDDSFGGTIRFQRSW